jgi:hypothetical protein
MTPSCQQSITRGIDNLAIWHSTNCIIGYESYHSLRIHASHSTIKADRISRQSLTAIALVFWLLLIWANPFRLWNHRSNPRQAMIAAKAHDWKLGLSLVCLVSAGICGWYQPPFSHSTCHWQDWSIVPVLRFEPSSLAMWISQLSFLSSLRLWSCSGSDIIPIAPSQWNYQAHWPNQSDISRYYQH